ncbi:GNAT family N-acetyltransferase [Cellulomonas sp.]|uniref:GNAT family N-acetyltransferase n=1 Tax=Cellulomonas sp. TaxID=40001 RepID=UPI001B14E56F|nr:GNAT family N-acetyltransferase [Cellulomonas sp.]MBO9555720.1 GNAT family N-acetyltransferase [Cellulomonas sp.]
MSSLLDGLPEGWRRHRMLDGLDARWQDAVVVGDDRAVLLASPSPRGPFVLVLGAGPEAGRLLTDVVARRQEPGSPLARAGFVDHAAWLNVTRAAEVPAAVLLALGLAPFSVWDWLSTDQAPPAHDDEPTVRRLDPGTEADAIRACLALGNPGTSADPTRPGEAGWWGVDGPGGLLGVVGATSRGVRGRASWHVHGLGVVPDARTGGLGTALTRAAVRQAFADGVAFVSLGMYAQNAVARRLYTRLGFTIDAELASFGPAGAERPPA